MMNNKSSLRFVFLFIFYAFVIVSCGDDDESDSIDNGNSTGSEIVNNLMNHKWYCYMTSYDSWSQGVSQTTATYEVYFTSTSQGVMHVKERENDSSLGSSSYENDIDFTYSIQGKIITLYGGSNFVFEYYGDYMMMGNDKFIAKALTSSDYSYLQDHKNGYHGTNGEVKATMIFECTYKGVNSLENGWYAYILEPRIGVTEDTYKKGVTQVRVTFWSDKGDLNGYKTSGYGKKRTFTYNISSSDLVWRDMILVCSKERSITVHYTVEYYNSKDRQWYEYSSDKRTLNV